MLFSTNLEEIIFNRHQVCGADELIILSGYLGPNPVRRLGNLPIKSTVIYGMYANDGIGQKLHNSLIDIEKNISNTTILYSQVAVHSKCYIWKKNNKIVHALIGSANFSTNGLSIPYKEILAETTYDTFEPLDQYLKQIINNTISCTSAQIKLKNIFKNTSQCTKVGILDINTELNPDICNMVLYDPSTGEVPSASGLNWGQGSKAHTKQNDAYIPIRAHHIKNYPELFPPKQIDPNKVNNEGRKQRHNDAIEIIWDDGVTMEGLLEGSYTSNGTVYPKQIASFPKKEVLGEYIRNRIGVPSGSKVSKSDLDKYGKSSIDVSLQSEGVYFFDFSVKK